MLRKSPPASGVPPTDGIGTEVPGEDNLPWFAENYQDIYTKKINIYLWTKVQRSRAGAPCMGDSGPVPAELVEFRGGLPVRSS